MNEEAKALGQDLRHWYKDRQVRTKRDTHTTRRGRRIRIRDIYEQLEQQKDTDEDPFEGVSSISTQQNTEQQKLRAENATLRAELELLRTKRQDLSQEDLATPIEQEASTITEGILQLRFFEQRPEVLQDNHPRYLRNFLQRIRRILEEYEEPEGSKWGQIAPDEGSQHVLWHLKRIRAEEKPGVLLRLYKQFGDHLGPWLEDALDEDQTQYNTGNPTPVPKDEPIRTVLDKGKQPEEQDYPTPHTTVDVPSPVRTPLREETPADIRLLEQQGAVSKRIREESPRPPRATALLRKDPRTTLDEIGRARAFETRPIPGAAGLQENVEIISTREEERRRRAAATPVVTKGDKARAGDKEAAASIARGGNPDEIELDLSD